jgi:hypothetical protein
MPTVKRAALGKPLPAVSGEIVPPSQQDIDLIVANWDAYAPAKYRGMLSARPIGTDDPKARWFYDDQRGRYISRAGNVVTPQELRLAYLAYQKAINSR